MIADVGTPKRGHARIDARLQAPSALRRDMIGTKDAKIHNRTVHRSVQERRSNGAREDASFMRRSHRRSGIGARGALN